MSLLHSEAGARGQFAEWMTALNEGIVAEGIEHEVQAAQMLDCGILLGQGWLLGVPEPMRGGQAPSESTPNDQPA